MITEEAQIKRDEGMKKVKGEHVSYYCPAGHLTGGYGHLLSRSERDIFPEGTVIPEGTVNHWFKNDYLEAAKIVKNITKGWDLPDEAMKILTNMAFNLGETRLKKFRKMLKALANNDYQEAAKEMEDSDWYNQVGHRAKRLVKRMKAIKNVKEQRKGQDS